MEANLHFDQELEALKKTVDALEKEGLPLDEMVNLYEQGLTQYVKLKKELDDTTLRIKKVNQKLGIEETF